MNYTYILRCSDGSFYTGWTTDPHRRLKAHNAGRGAKYTRARLPVELIWYEMHSNRSDAMRREAEIKQLTRTQKLELMEREGMKP